MSTINADISDHGVNAGIYLICGATAVQHATSVNNSPILDEARDLLLRCERRAQGLEKRFITWDLRRVELSSLSTNALSYVRSWRFLNYWEK